MNVDLHCHSTVSDGLLAPAEVVARAADNGVEVLALTDHDEVSGLAEAGRQAAGRGIRLVSGVEISIEWRGTPIHIVGLGFDAASPALASGLESVRSGRVERARRMAAELEKVGIAGAFEGARALAENPTLISRAHFARWMVGQGICSEVHKVFDAYLVPGRPGYVEHRWAGVEEALAWIHDAGGIAVVAHPARYRISLPLLRNFLGVFRECGGEAIEVTSGSHTPEQVQIFARVAREFGFLASRGSDFHGPQESYVDLGRLPPLPEGLEPVWSKLL